MKLPAIITKNLKAHIVISTIVRLSMLGILITAAAELNFLLMFISSVMLFVSFLPSIMVRRFKIFLPPELEITFSLFLFAYFILGEMSRFFLIYWWWDLMLHSFAAFMLGLIGFLIMYIFHMTHKVRMSAALTSIFSFCFSLSLGVLWEMFEFSMDYSFGFNMQKSGLRDTMTDLVVDTLGALLVSVLGFLYIKSGKAYVIKRFVDKFTSMNRRLLRNIK